MFEKLKENLINLLETHRGLVIVFFCLPASLIFEFFLKIRKFFGSVFEFGKKNHLEKVAKIQADVRRWNEKNKNLPSNSKKLMCTSRPNWSSLSTTFFPKHEFHQISINLHQILKFSAENSTIKVEPLVTVAEVTEEF